MLDPLPLAPSWADLVDRLAADAGSLAELARSLQDAASASVALSDDPQTVERGLRRLRQRAHAPGDKYGRALLRVFGVPAPLAAWARALGQYHSRLSDLSVHVRRDQLRLWDRPPVAESRAAAWIHLGLASVAHRVQDAEQLEHRLGLAGRLLGRAGVRARLEHALFQARLAEDPEDGLAAAAKLLADVADRDDRLCYLARVADQRAYRAAREGPRASRITRSEALYAEIPEVGPPFVRFRRAHGLAWCAWRQGAHADARHHVAQAEEAAGDGGLLRFRVMALLLAAHIGDPRAAGRALAIAEALGDQALIAAAHRC